MEAGPKEWLAFGGAGRRGRLSVDISAIELVQGEETGLVLDWTSCDKDNSVLNVTSGDEEVCAGPEAEEVCGRESGGEAFPPLPSRSAPPLHYTDVM